jgi:hypothetical protein
MAPACAGARRPPLIRIRERDGMVGRGIHDRAGHEAVGRRSREVFGARRLLGHRDVTTKRANCSFVTSVSSIQNPSTATRWTGRESMVACIPTMSCASTGSCAPIENSPPGIHTMPAGAGPGGGCSLSTVGRNSADGGTATLDGIERSVKARIAAPAMATTASHNRRVERRGSGRALAGFERGLFMRGSARHL